MPPQFDLQIINRNGELAKESRVNISNTESSKDNLSIRTENSILELLDRDKILKEIVKIQEKSESHRCSSRTRNKSSERCKRGKKLSVLAKQNSDIAERLGKIEKSIERNVYVSRKPSLDALTEASLRSTSENFWNLEDIDNPISISTLFSENSDPKQFPYNTSRIKVYIPQGYPAYSSYYYVKYHSEAQIEEILASLCETMQIDKKGCVLKVKEIDGKNRNLDLKEKAKDLHKVSNGSLPKVYLQQIKKEI